jgi:hypothetical protein
MRIRDAGVVLSVALAVSLAAGCASTKAPYGRVPHALDTGRDARGGWVVAVLGQAGAWREIRGELIAVERDSVFVLTASGFESFPAVETRRAQVAGYQSGWPWLAGWTVLGTLSTISHGWFLVATVPLWVIVGTVSAAVASGAGIHRYPEMSWSDLALYARFPEGLPPEVRSRGLPTGWPAALPLVDPAR